MAAKYSDEGGDAEKGRRPEDQDREKVFRVRKVRQVHFRIMLLSGERRAPLIAAPREIIKDALQLIAFVIERLLVGV